MDRAKNPRYFEGRNDRQEAAAPVIAVGDPAWHKIGSLRQAGQGLQGEKIVDP